ncbi:interferon alpha-inducible protein 27, mitochondrial-like isoform X1 [Rhincodon typus]|uniref:interferon alpha-inducible protein 27, mitochondrial-like isoform X1 n=1 Tax=Rhincodon typus TaxID=259920 RepID=UPI00202E91A0|nr:interferon alpha-inducible protein 27, mitochondrial-like isoform X1 [Rhincodon typus]XP_048449022.1 interferon alpha-inducible protein 27, mitochondrial-like isoform X1 [Rhincodon typus]
MLHLFYIALILSASFSTGSSSSESGYSSNQLLPNQVSKSGSINEEGSRDDALNQLPCTFDWSTAAWIAGGAVAAVVATPVVVAAAGFTGAGIAAGSLAAQMMSAAAVANGGGVAAGGVVATLQSIGTAGLSAYGTAVVGSVGAAAGCAAKSTLQDSEDEL